MPPRPPRSGEVSADRRVTFRLRAPNAQQVSAEGNWPGEHKLALAKGADGLWTVTTPPLDAEIWSYTYVVDGTAMLDPGNFHVVRDGTRYLNTVLIPGPASVLYQARAVPHGTVAAVWYRSSTLKAPRRLLVYTPPGYDDSHDRYPVLYLFHGGGGDEEAWDVMGSANVIMDNLIANQRAKPMIVVMPNANWNQTAALDLGGDTGEPPPLPTTPGRSANATGTGADYARGEREVVGDIIPFIERSFRTLSGRDQRAIAGLSMGGGISINIGLKRLDQFASVAEFSSGMFGGVNGYAPFDFGTTSPGFLTDPKTTNERLKVLYFSCGADDPRMPFQKKAVEQLRSSGVHVTFESFPGMHEWRVWRNSLASLAPLLFH
ncbi:MAG: hypothetical protein JO022_09860 [Acidobacteriaceae bacterium]|nr:hypothetical protein [Acidobacteriaceae bacterium]